MENFKDKLELTEGTFEYQLRGNVITIAHYDNNIFRWSRILNIFVESNFWSIRVGLIILENV
jgi:hypothetical protein